MYCIKMAQKGGR